jgi:Response regulator receiver domain
VTTFTRAEFHARESEGFVVVGEALNGLDGAAAVRELDPDIVLVDVTLPEIDGFQIVKRLAVPVSERPRTRPLQGRMFWFRRKTLSGSQARFSSTRRRYFSSP